MMLKRNLSQVENVCYKCNKKCKTPEGLKRHMNIHSVSNCFSCTICKYVTERYDCFILHFKKSHSGEASFPCNDCTYQTTNSSYFARHRILHSGIRSYNCLQSRIRLNRKYNFIINMKTHSKEKLKNTRYRHKKSFANPYTCDYCDDTFLQKCSLIAHVKSLHEREKMSTIKHEAGEKLHRCVQCAFTTKWKHSLQRHQIQQHRGETKLETVGSVKKSDRSRLVKTRLPKATEETSLNCIHCNYKAPNMYRLNHHSMIHSGLKPYKCTRCTFASRWPDNLKSHIRIKHPCEGIVPELKNTIILPNKHKAEVFKSALTRKSGAKPYACNRCSYRAALKHHLIRHLNIHTRGAIFSCPNCSYVSTRKDSVQVHMRLKHLEEKAECLPYIPSSKASKKGKKVSRSLKQSGRSRLVKTRLPKTKEETSHNCNHCNYKAPNMNRLNLHLMIHSGFKPYKCLCCTFASRWPDNLKRHIRTNHPGEGIVPELKNTTILPNKHQADVLKRAMTSKSVAKPYACNRCSYRGAFKHSLTRHLKIHTRDTLYSCPKCSYVSVRRDHVQVHMRLKHLKEIGESFPYIPSSKAHKNLKTRPFYNKTKLANRQFVCSKCNYRTDGELRLKLHLMIHSGKKPYDCPYCSHASRWSYDLKKHMKSKHPEIDDLKLSQHLKQINRSVKSKLQKKHYKNKCNSKKTFAVSVHYRAANKQLLDHHSMVHLSETQFKNESELTENLESRSTLKDSKDKIVPASSENVNLLSSVPNSRLFKTTLAMANYPEKKPLSCNHCSFKAINTTYLTRHVMVHSGVEPYRCEDCNFVSGWKCHLQKHVKSKHPRKELKHDPSEGEKESNSLDESSRIKRQETKRSEENSFCCNKPTFTVKHHLKSQGLSRNSVTHSARMPHKCLHCRFATSTNEQLKKHMKLKHSGKIQKEDFDECSIDQDPALHKGTEEKKLSCPHCNFHTAYRHSLRRHLHTHFEGKLFKCSQCPFASKQYNTLKKHIENNHTKMDVVSRLVPKKSSLNKVNQSILETTKQNLLKRTEYPRTALNSGVSKSGVVRNLSKKPFASHRVDKNGRIKRSYDCPHCTYVSRLPQTLKSHIRIQHSGVKFGSQVHSCTYDNCGYKTIHTSNFKKHLLTHTGMKPHQCQKCEKSFTQKGNLNNHMKLMHPSKEEFACGLCSFKTTDFNQLKMHLTTSHDEEEI